MDHYVLTTVEFDLYPKVCLRIRLGGKRMKESVQM